MKKKRHERITELITQFEIETQEELVERLTKLYGAENVKVV